MKLRQRATSLLLVSLNTSKRSCSGFQVKPFASAARQVVQSCIHQVSTRTVQAMSSSTSPAFPSVADFLKQSSSRPLSSDSPRLVLGNPAGDADSIISAIGVAYFETAVRHRPTVPILSIPLEDLKSQRPETKFLLSLAGIVDLDHSFVTIADVLPDVACVTLVDHNQLKVKSKDWTVEGILDHHLDEKAHIQTCPIGETNDDRIIAFDESSSTALVASTCTLVVERWQKYRHSHVNSTESGAIPPTLAILLLGVILLDSINLSPTAGKATPRDLEAVEILRSETDWSNLVLPAELCANGATGPPDLNLLFDTLQNQKFKPEFWDGLTGSQALKLDYKSFKVEGDDSVGQPSAFGISSVLQSMSDFLDKPNIWKSISHEYFPAVQVFVIMFMTVINDIPRRQIVLTSPKQSLLDSLVDFMRQEGSMQIEVIDHTKDTETGLFIVKIEQGNSKASRKQVAPIFMNFFAKTNSSESM